MNKKSKSKRGDITQQVWEYLSDQYHNYLPATCAHFCAIKGIIISRDKFRDCLKPWKRNFVEDTKKMHWFNEIRLNNEKCAPEERAIYFPSMEPRTDSSSQIWNYLTEQYECNLPATWFHFCAVKKIDISSQVYNNGVQGWKRSFKDNAGKMIWFNNIRLNKEHVPAVDGDKYFPISQYELCRQYLNEQCAANLPATKYHFCQTKGFKISPKEFGKCVFSWKNQFASDPRKMDWFDKVRHNNKRAPKSEKNVYFPALFRTSGNLERVLLR